MYGTYTGGHKSLYGHVLTKLLLFGTFEIAMSRPVKIGKTYIPQKKALLPIYFLKEVLKLEEFLP